MGNDWFFTGDDAKKKQEIDARTQDRKAKERAEYLKNRVFRFYLPVGAETQITFVDGNVHPDGYRLPFVYEEHNHYLNNSWKNWMTCIAKIRGSDGEAMKCPSCIARPAEPVYLATAYTIIDHSEWTDKKGTTHKDELKLFVAKHRTVLQLDKFLAKYGTLRGCRFDVSRTDDKKASVGDTFILDEQVDLRDDIQPFKYTEILKPKSIEEMKDILGIYDEEESDERIRF